MYDLHLSAEQLEMRDTVRDFVQREIKPVALNPKRLEPFDKPLLTALLDKASQMGLRTLALSEAAGGAGADNLTCCLVLEELAAGDVDIALALAHTALLGRILFDEAMTPQQRERFLPQFVEDDGYHLAFAGRDGDAALGWQYHRPDAGDPSGGNLSARRINGEWVINGVFSFVANAPLARLFAVQVQTGTKGITTLLVPCDTPGLTVRQSLGPADESALGDAPSVRWHHGPGAGVEFRDCRLPADHLLGKEGASPLANGAYAARGATLTAAANLGIGQAAYEAARDYAKIRRQGGRNIIEHQAIGTILAECAIKLEAARSLVWKAAWVLDHPDAVSERSVAAAPFHRMARVFASQMAHEVTLSAAECFGAMGVMRDMPLHQYVNDALVFLHGGIGATPEKLHIAEGLAGFRRPVAA
jgi:alkylation response protein AidB-like acyl-CoA dehydrogenase